MPQTFDRMANGTMDVNNELANMMAKLSVANQVRKQTKLDMPDPKLVLEFEDLAFKIMRREKFGRSERIQNKRIVSHFGAPPVVLAKVWELLVDNVDMDRGAEKKHLLWTLHSAKQYSTESTTCTMINVQDEKTLRKWKKHFFEYVAFLEPIVIKWENRYINDVGDDALASVDTVDFKFQQVRIPNPKKPGATMVNKALFSHKYNGPGL